MMVDDNGSERGQEDPRLAKLDARLDRVEAVEVTRTQQVKVAESDPSYRMGSKVLSDLLGGLIGGAVLGYGFDWLFATRPWGLICFPLLGLGIAFRSIIKSSGGSTKG